jgi:hypothetical protein
MTCTVSVFLGPSLPPEQRIRTPLVRYLPPAAAGDMLRLADSSPHRVVLIDGLFERAASPWPKEIIALMARGFDVWGAASMGALRAAELSKYGMVPVGAIAAAYAHGRINADAEVAVVHAPAALGFRPLSLAQIDARATLASAAHKQVISLRTARRIREISAGIHYKLRSWDAVLAATLGQVHEVELRRLASWLDGGAFSQKAVDAAAAIRTALHAPQTERRDSPAPPMTSFYRRLQERVRTAPSS